MRGRLPGGCPALEPGLRGRGGTEELGCRACPIPNSAGSASFGANDAYLQAIAIENNFGIFFGAANRVNGGNGSSLNDGLRCAGGSLVRLTPPTLVVTGNMAVTPQPVPVLDLAATPGVTRRYQYWFRTPGGPCGQMANLTNGLEIVWLP